MFPLDELLPLPKLHPAETVTAKEKELSPIQQVESIGKSTRSTAANESSKPSVDASNGLANDGSSKMSGQEKSAIRSENETKPDENESTPLGPSQAVGGEPTLLGPTKPLGNEPTLPDPPMSESTSSIQPVQLKTSDQQASDPKTPSMASVPTASSTTAIDLTISLVPSPTLSTQPQPDSDNHVPADPVISSISTTAPLPILSSWITHPPVTSFQAVRISDVIYSPSSFHNMNAAGDNWAYDPESLRIPSYSPMPTTRVLITPNPEMILDDMRSRAESLLTRGCMPLLAPARRNWTSEEEIKLPLYSPFDLWPPRRWMALSSDMKLMVWESAAMALALKDGFVDLDRGEILDHYKFLAPPSSASPQLKSSFQTSRYFTFKVVRDIFLGKTQASESNKRVITMLEAANSAAFKSSTTEQILEQMERKGISVRVMQLRHIT